MRWIVIYVLEVVLFLSVIHSQTIMTREEAAQYALRAAKALNTSVRWLSISELPVGEEVCEDEIDKIDKYALMGFDYENIVSIIKRLPLGKSHFLDNINYYFPCDHGSIIVNAFSGATYVIGKFPTNITELNEQQITSLASNIVNTFFGSIDHEWKINISSLTDEFITVHFSSHKPSIGLKSGRRRAHITFNHDGSIRSAYFYPLSDDINISMTLEQAKEIVSQALEEAYTTGKTTYLYFYHHEIIKINLPKVRFICFGKHSEAVATESLFRLFPIYEEKEEGIYFYEEDYFLQPKYVYVILATIEIVDNNTKEWTCYLIDINTHEVEGLGLTDFTIYFLGAPMKVINKQTKNKDITNYFKNIVILDDKLVTINYALFRNNRIYIDKNYLPVFKAHMQDNKLYGRNGHIHLNKDDLLKFKNRLYISLRRICEITGIRLWWDNLRKIPILRSEWLRYRKFPW